MDSSSSFNFPSRDDLVSGTSSGMVIGRQPCHPPADIRGVVSQSPDDERGCILVLEKITGYVQRPDQTEALLGRCLPVVPDLQQLIERFLSDFQLRLGTC